MSLTKSAIVCASLLAVSNANAILITINPGTAPQPANAGQATIEAWIAAGVTSYNAANDPDLPAPGLEVFRVNKDDATAPAGYPTFGSGTLSITIPTGEYDYVALHWGGGRGENYQSFYIGDIGGAPDASYTFQAPGQQGLSFYDVFRKTDRQVPDAGASVALLGLGVAALGVTRRMIKR